ncbi:MAG: permease [Spirochaetes bacterium]|nr:MAG: permease [Spirochaetota bacterium]RKX87634.1 MAG: permease [Spirochaetota bacterium]RKX97928.1 MAG: permease [Spirochaetota bacterium]
MNITVIFINAAALLGLIISFSRNKEKSMKALKMALKSTFKMAPAILILLILVGLMMGFFKPETISRLLGEQSGIYGIVLASIAGSILMIPSLIAFPLTASIVDSGASIAVAAAFITTLTMIGFVTLPIEIKIMGRKFTYLRNGLSLVVAVVIALIMGVIL